MVSFSSGSYIASRFALIVKTAFNFRKVKPPVTAITAHGILTCCVLLMRWSRLLLLCSATALRYKREDYCTSSFLRTLQFRSRILSSENMWGAGRSRKSRRSSRILLQAKPATYCTCSSHSNVRLTERRERHLELRPLLPRRPHIRSSWLSGFPTSHWGDFVFLISIIMIPCTPIVAFIILSGIGLFFWIDRSKDKGKKK
jgi:hypothetical protein